MTIGCVWFGYEKTTDACTIMVRSKATQCQCPHNGNAKECPFVQSGIRHDRNERRRFVYQQGKAEVQP